MIALTLIARLAMAGDTFTAEGQTLNKTLTCSSFVLKTALIRFQSIKIKEKKK